MCGKAFEETDDIVACPKCGAPHHRACWQEVGHCALQDAHDTPEQWSREKAQKAVPEQPAPKEEPTQWVCPSCGTHNLEFAEFCTKCGKGRDAAPDWHSAPENSPPTQNTYREYTPFPNVRPMQDPFGGVARDEMLAEDVSAADAVAFTAVNSHYYLPRFRNIANGNKFSWNWAAFLLTPYWLLYRKSFIAGFTALFISMVQGLFSYQVAQQMMDMIGTGLSQQEMMNRTSQLMMENEVFRYLSIALILLSLVDLVIRLLMGICGNWIYQVTAFSKIRKAKEKQPEQCPLLLSKIGGVSFVSGMLAYLLSDYLIQFFYMMLK